MAADQDDTRTTGPEVATQSPPETKPSSAGTVAAGRRFSTRSWILSVVLGLVVAGFAIPVAFTISPGQCASCHEMKPYYDSWQNSSHRGAAPNCLYCHVKPGVLNLVGYEFAFYGEIAGHFSGAVVATTAANAPAVQSCQRAGCHSLNRETSNAGDIKINHRLHVIQAKIPCTSCHPGAVHAGVGGRLKLPPMKLCKTCHADKMQTCNFCHSEQRLQGVPAGVH
jgi:hypothetical protein